MSAEECLAVLVQRWQKLREQGETVAAEVLCRDCPELLEPLRQRLAALGAEPPPEVIQTAVFLAEENRTGTDNVVTIAKPTQPLPKEEATWPRLEGYLILDELGRGGMGVVYKAVQLNLDRVVALKMILSGSHASKEDLRRFRHEAETIASLQHPNLIQVYEVGEQEGRAYFSMEYVEGRTLDDHAAGQAQPPRQVAELVATLARTMHAVHQKGIIHRDLKPSNVLITPEGVAKIMDFGLAKRMDSTKGVTLTGDIVGTPRYMAPEQAAGKSKQVGPATDIYALGVILYELLAGIPPFQADSAYDTIMMVMREEAVPLRRFNPKVPADLETICLKCLQKDPAKRYGTALAFAEDLGRFLANEPIAARPTGPLERAIKWMKRRPAMATLLGVSAMAVVVLLVSGAIYNAQLRLALDEVNVLAEENRQKLVRLQITQGAMALEDGDWFTALLWFVEAFRHDQDDPERELLHRLRIGVILQHCPHLLQVWQHPTPVRHIAFSPDGRHVATASDDGLARVFNVQTGLLVGQPFKHQGPVVQAIFSPDGTKLATASRDGTGRVWDWTVGRPLGEALKHEGPVVLLVFAPDGRSLATASEDKTARLWETNTGRPQSPALRHQQAVACVAFSPDGRWLATASADRTARIWSTTDGSPRGPPLLHDGAVHWVAFHPHHDRLATASADGATRIWDQASGKLCQPPLKSRDQVMQTVFNPDGQVLAAASDDHTAYLWDVSTGAMWAPRIHHDSGVNTVAFHPREPWLLTTSDDNSARLWVAAENRPLTPRLNHQGTVNQAVFNPNGQLVATASNDRMARLWKTAPDRPKWSMTPHRQPPPKGGTGDRKWLSPDGRWLVSAEGDHGAQVRSAATGKALGPLLTHGSVVVFAAFSADNSYLVTASDDNMARIWNPQTGRLLARPLKHKGTVRHAAFDPKGFLVITASDDGTARVWAVATGEPITPPLPITGHILETTFFDTGAGARVTTDKGFWTGEIKPEPRSLAVLTDLAEVLASSRLTPKLGVLPLESEELVERWQRLRARFGPNVIMGSGE